MSESRSPNWSMAASVLGPIVMMAAVVISPSSCIMGAAASNS